MKHTPGKWVMTPSYKTANDCREKKNPCNFNVKSWYKGQDPISIVNMTEWQSPAEQPSIEEMEANANLIAKAPAMLNKLKSLQSWMKRFPKKAGISLPDHIWGELQDQYRLLEIIINKAEGK